MRASAVVLAVLVLAAGATAEAEQDLVTEGARWWRTSPDPGNPVACATCHHDTEAVRGWAASFPKVRPLPPPHARVMTLLQATAEAVALHYRLVDPRPAATAITAYLIALGADRAVTPGVAAGQPVFPARLARLRTSVERGQRLFAWRCADCHRPADVARWLAVFPRWRDGRAESVEGFLEDHHPRGPRLRWDGQPVADLLAALTVRLGGRPLGKEIR